MKQTIKINGFAPKTSANGKNYYVFTTEDKQSLSCWSETVSNQLMGLILKDVDVDVVENNGFKTIRAIWTANYVEPVSKSFQKQEFRNETMYVSYAKDLFIALINNKELLIDHSTKGKEILADNVMLKACELVDQAKAHFTKGGA